MEIDIAKKYRTRHSKSPVIIVSINGPCPGFPVVGYACGHGTPLLCHWSEVGVYPANTNLDLIEIREPREWDMWVNLKGNLTNNSDVMMREAVRVREIID